tara:strand:+ start:322 stop:531 length:210 start_codon:yes stop_codon:yes gene_type:complete
MSSNGDPGGNLKGNGFPELLIVCVVDILTTDGISFSAKSANEAGALLLYTGKIIKFDKNIIKIKLNCLL